MTKEKKENLSGWITGGIVAALVVFLVGYNVGIRNAGSHEQPPTTQHDTLFIPEPVYVEHLKTDTVFDTVQVIRDYFTLKTYEFDFKDSVSFGKISLTLSHNKPQNIVIENNPLPKRRIAEKQTALWIGGTAIAGPAPDIAPHLHLQRGRNLFGAGYAVANKQVMLSYNRRIF